jgi:hypothetical protein
MSKIALPAVAGLSAALVPAIAWGVWFAGGVRPMVNAITGGSL